MAPVTRKNPPHTPAAKPKPTPKPKKSKKHAPPPHQPAPPPPPRPTPAELKRYADQAVDMVLGKWPECDPGNSLNKVCCIDQLDGTLWRCIDCNKVYRKNITPVGPYTTGLKDIVNIKTEPGCDGCLVLC